VKRALLGIIGLALLAGCDAAPVPPPVVTTSSSPRPVDECAKHGVKFDVTGADAAMGIRVLTLEMENCGSSPLTVNGYPSLRLFDEDREPIDVTVAKGSGNITTMPDFDVPPQDVTLQPGEKARAGLVWRNLVTDATVKATTAYHLEAAPAEGKSWQDVPLVVPNEVSGSTTVDIDLGNTGKLGVQPWTKP
jgi:hypothetical protein